jgi:hypothetical protein
MTIESLKGRYEQMQKAIAECQLSGQRQQRYCHEHNIKYHVFHYYYKRYRDQQNVTSGFTAVKLMENTACAAIELQTASGHRPIFHQPVSSAFLKSLIQ